MPTLEEKIANERAAQARRDRASCSNPRCKRPSPDGEGLELCSRCVATFTRAGRLEDWRDYVAEREARALGLAITSDDEIRRRREIARAFAGDASARLGRRVVSDGREPDDDCDDDIDTDEMPCSLEQGSAVEPGDTARRAGGESQGAGSLEGTPGSLVQHPTPSPESEDDMSRTKSNRIGTCNACGEKKLIKCRGLCSRCYNKHRTAGTLEEVALPRMTPQEAGARGAEVVKGKPKRSTVELAKLRSRVEVLEQEKAKLEKRNANLKQTCEDHGVALEKAEALLADDGILQQLGRHLRDAAVEGIEPQGDAYSVVWLRELMAWRAELEAVSTELGKAHGTEPPPPGALVAAAEALRVTRDSYRQSWQEEADVTGEITVILSTTDTDADGTLPERVRALVQMLENTRARLRLAEMRRTDRADAARYAMGIDWGDPLKRDQSKIVVHPAPRPELPQVELSLKVNGVEVDLVARRAS